MPSFQYGIITQNTNFEPIGVDVRRDGELLPALGVNVSLTVKDRDLKDVDGQRVVIVEDAAASPHPTIAGRWEYYFTPEQVADVTATRVWLVEWKITFGIYTYRLDEPATLIVRKKL